MENKSLFAFSRRMKLFNRYILRWNDFIVSLCDMLFANTHKFIHEARRLLPVIYGLQITYHKDQIYRKIRYWVLISILLFLSACGFKPYNQFSSPLHIVYLQTSNPYDSFNIKLKQVLQFSGVKLVSNINDAPITLSVLNVSLSHDNPNIASSSQATIYNFTYTVAFELKNNKENISTDRQYITITRALTLNPNEILEVSNEVKIMKKEMERELIGQLFNRLESNEVKVFLGQQISNENKIRSTTTTTKK